MQKLLQLLHCLRPLSPHLSGILEQSLRHKSIPKGLHFIRKGQALRLTFFVDSGMVRCYHESNDGIITSHLMADGDIYAVAPPGASEFLKQSIQALEDTQLWYLSHDQLEDIYRQFPEFNFHGRLLMQRYVSLAEKVRYMLQLSSKSERYAYFRNHFPALVKRAPIGDLASYLQMSEFTLCRVRQAFGEGKYRGGHIEMP